MLSTTDELRELSQVDTVDLKPPNVSFKNHKPLSISNVESFQSEDGHLLTPTNQYGGSSRNVTLKRSETRSLYAKHKLQRVVSRRFGDNNNKRIIKRALSQFLIDEEVWFVNYYMIYIFIYIYGHILSYIAYYIICI